MKTFKSILTFQLKRAVNKRSIRAFCVIAAVLQLFLQVGRISHSEIIDSQETFQRQERQKMERYSNIGQYGSFGIWIKLIPHENSILFSDSTFYNLYCNADSTYVLNIYLPVKGRGYFANRSRFLNFSIMFVLFGVLACLFYGTDMTVKKGYLKFISIIGNQGKIFFYSIIARFIIILSAALALYAISLLPLLFFGINLFITSFPIFLGIILLFLFSFCLGVLLGYIKEQLNRILTLLILYFFMGILLPWALGFYSEISAKDMPKLIEYDYENFNILMNNEKYLEKKHGDPKGNGTSDEAIRDYKKVMRNIKKIFRDKEEKLKNQSLIKIKSQQTIASFLPTLFFFSICESNASVGGINYIDFYTYCLEKKDKFVDFNIKKSPPTTKNIENFIKGNEDLYFATPALPFNFWLGVFLTLFYTALFLFLSYRIQEKKNRPPVSKESYRTEKDKDNPLFVLCENQEIKQDIFNFYQSQKKAICLEKINTYDFTFYGVKSHELYNHLCQVKGVEEKRAIEHLGHMGIKDITALPVCHEIILKIYAAVTTAADHEVIVLNDFLLNASRELEKSILNLLFILEKSGKKIIYLSTQMYQEKNNLGEIVSKKFKGEKFFNVRINLNKVSFR